MAGRRFALLVGSSEFGNKAELKPLRCPPDDVRGLAKVLLDSECGGFDRVEELVNEEDTTVARRLNEMLLEAALDDLVLIYYSGHGKLNRRGNLHLAMPNTVPANVETTSLPIVNVRNYIENCNAERVVLILDCCYSGRVGDAFMKSSVGDNLSATFQRPGSGVYILTASTGIESAVEKDGDLYSIFTAPLIEGLATGRADVDHDGWVSMDELYGYVLSEVQKVGKQTPMRWNLSSVADIRIARNPRYSSAPAQRDRWNALLDLGRSGAVPGDVLVDALAFLEGRRQPFDVAKGSELIDQVVQGDIDHDDFVRGWRQATEDSASTARPPVRVLSIDGGGVRVVLAARVLAELERRAGRPVRELFDLVAGTSFGGLLALAITAGQPGSPDPIPSYEFVERFEAMAPRLFTQGLLKRLTSVGGATEPRYDPSALREFVQEMFPTTTLSEITDVELFVSAYELERQMPFHFRSRLARDDPENDFWLKDVALGATAIPAMLPPVAVDGVTGSRSYILIDGSTFMSNPAMAAYAEALRMRPTAAAPYVLSLGTGAVTRPIRIDVAKNGARSTGSARCSTSRRTAWRVKSTSS